MTLKILSNLSKVYGGIHEDSSRTIMQSILKVIDIKCENDTLTYSSGGISYNMRINYEDNIHFSITPLKLNSYDVECIEDILNNHYSEFKSSELSDFFLAIGYSLVNEGSQYRVVQLDKFKPDQWKYIDTDWKEEGGWKGEADFDPLLKELNGDICDWKRGTGWVDGIDFENIEINWKKDLEQDNE